LRVVSGPAGLYRAWLAVREVEDSEDLRARLARTPPPDEDEIGAALQAVRRMHDAGILHPDLNLGNLLIRAGTAGPEAWVLDLDRAVVAGAAALPAAPRIRALCRLERSYAKEFGDTGPLGPSPLASWLQTYAPSDSALDGAIRRAAERPPRGRRLRRWWWRLRGEGAQARLGD
jgi:hypothetical protein